jgi:hypothetical protein
MIEIEKELKTRQKLTRKVIEPDDMVGPEGFEPSNIVGSGCPQRRNGDIPLPHQQPEISRGLEP